MSNVIDSLIIQLGLETKDFKKGQKETTEGLKKTEDQANRSQKEIAAGNKKTVESYAGVKGAVMALGLAVVSSADSVKNFIEKTVQADMSVVRLSKNVGLGADQLSAWEGAGKRLGAQAGDMGNAFRNVMQIVQDVSQKGTSGALNPLQRMGVDMDLFLNKSTSAEQRMMLIADAMKKLSPEDRQFWGSQAGFSESQINALGEGSEKIKEILADQAKINAHTKEYSAALEKITTQWTRLKEQFEGFGKDFITGAAPAIVNVLTWMNDHALLTAAGIGGLTLALKGMVASAGLKVLQKLGIASAPEAAATAGKVGMMSRAATGIGALLYSSDAGAGSDFSTAERLRMSNKTNSSELFAGLEKQYGLPQGLLDSMWTQESGRGKTLLNKQSGAKGHFQFMDATAKQYGLKNPNDLNESAQAAAHMMSDLLKQYHGDLPSSLAAYNWGSGNLNKKGMASAPAETQNYIPSIMGRMGAQTGAQSVTIASMTVNTKATDANGIARDIGKAMDNYMFTAQANTGAM